MRTAIIGIGRMGRRHIQVVRDLGLDLVGVCDQNPESLALTAQQYGVRAGCQFTDASVLLASTRPECVIVSTTAPTHSSWLP